MSSTNFHILMGVTVTLVLLLALLFILLVTGKISTNSQAYTLQKDTLYVASADIYLIPISDSLSHKQITVSLTDGSFDKWLSELKRCGYVWEGPFGFFPYHYVPFKRIKK